jgi:hypothetical protein
MSIDRDELLAQVLADPRRGEEVLEALDAEIERNERLIVEYQDKIAELRCEHARQQFLDDHHFACRRAEIDREIHSLEQQIGELVGDPNFADDPEPPPRGH